MNFPHLLPAPRRVKLRRQHCAEFDSPPLSVSGVSSAVINAVNLICGNLPPFDPPAGAKLSDGLADRIPLFDPGLTDHPLFIPAAEKAARSRPPEIIVQMGQGFAPKFPSIGQPGFDAVEIRQQAYRVTVSNRPRGAKQPAVMIQTETETAVRYALLTLAQILRFNGRKMPGLSIEDAPVFKHRGFMLDVSRDRVPLLSELEKLIDLLASLKYNHFQLYTEHTFAYAGHEEVWHEASPLTAEEVHHLDGYCADRDIVLAANQNCFGHLTRWLKHSRYQSLAETIGEWKFREHLRSGPFSLCPTEPGSLEFVEDLLDQLLPNFTSGLLNVGCDETYDVGQGRSLESVAKEGFFRICWSFVEKIFKASRKRGFRPMFWADLLLRDDAPFDVDIGDAVALVWGYEPHEPWEDWLSKANARRCEVWVCPGTSSWCSITGRSSERSRNLNEAAKAGSENGAVGMLVTEWGDSGHRQQFPLTLAGIAAGAGAAWNAEGVGALSLTASLPVFGDWSETIGPWLETIGDTDYLARRKAGSSSADSNAPIPLTNRTFLFDEMERSRRMDYRPIKRDYLDNARETLETIVPFDESSLDPLTADECRHLMKVARWALDKSYAVRFPEGDIAPVWSRLRAEMLEIIEEHQRLWLARSRPGGLEDSCRCYQALVEDIDLDV